MTLVIDNLGSKIEALTKEVRESNDNMIGKLTKMKEKADIMEKNLGEVRDKVNKLIVQRNNLDAGVDAPLAKRAYRS